VLQAWGRDPGGDGDVRRSLSIEITGMPAALVRDVLHRPRRILGGSVRLRELAEFKAMRGDVKRVLRLVDEAQPLPRRWWEANPLSAIRGRGTGCPRLE